MNERASKFVNGEDLLDGKVAYTEYGRRIIHHTWKTTEIPPKRRSDYDSWTLYHPEGVLRVFWTDKGNQRLVEESYAEFKELYHSLELPIERVDMVRLLYLHKYGGIYAGLDYEVKTNLFDVLPSSDKDAVMAVQSGVLLNEVLRNSLMVANSPGHPYWYACVRNIGNIIRFINDPEKRSRWKLLSLV